MGTWLRLGRTVVSALLAPRLAVPDGTSVLTMRVWPNDLDFNAHMNNGRYLTLMDLGRVDLLLRAGLGRTILAKRWTAVLTGATIRYRRSLKPFQRFRLETSIAGWTEHAVFIEQRFIIASGAQAGEVAASAAVRASLLHPGSPARKVRITELFAALGLAPRSPPLPEIFVQLGAGTASIPPLKEAAI